MPDTVTERLVEDTKERLSPSQCLRSPADARLRPHLLLKQ